MWYDTRPPERLSDLITLAIADARNLDRTRYLPLAEAWHRGYPETPGVPPCSCNVCLAGCMIAGALEASCADDVRVCNPTGDRTRAITIEDPDWHYALYSVDGARQGLWLGAVVTPGYIVDDNTTRRLREVPPPDQDTFAGWNEFDIHLASLEDRVTRLRRLAC